MQTCPQASRAAGEGSQGIASARSFILQDPRGLGLQAPFLHAAHHGFFRLPSYPSHRASRSLTESSMVILYICMGTVFPCVWSIPSPWKEEMGVNPPICLSPREANTPAQSPQAGGGAELGPQPSDPQPTLLSAPPSCSACKPACSSDPNEAKVLRFSTSPSECGHLRNSRAWEPGEAQAGPGHRRAFPPHWAQPPPGSGLCHGGHQRPDTIPAPWPGRLGPHRFHISLPTQAIPVDSMECSQPRPHPLLSFLPASACVSPLLSPRLLVHQGSLSSQGRLAAVTPSLAPKLPAEAVDRAGAMNKK